jgi:xanthine/CO dehydrogenase XdhC/CoxF family maturation factor
MHLGISTLLDFYRAHRDDDALILGTIIATRGSTYRKPGAMMLIAKDGSHRGLISGGCLESDLAEHAQQVLLDGEVHKIIYDLSADTDLVWGLGIGCDGAIELMLQRLEASDDFGFLAMLESAWEARQDGVLRMVINSNDSDRQPGSITFTRGDDSHDLSRRYWLETITTDTGDMDMLMVPVKPPPALLVCGAGIDAVPLTRLAIEMGWDCTVVDHRSGFASADRFPDSCDVRVLQAKELACNVELGRFDAAVIMGHNLKYDRQYLSQLVEAPPAYIGLLGPRARRDQLLDQIGVNSATANVHVRGPAGLDIGAEMPESIALAIVAEIHACLNQRTGNELTPPGS